MLNNHTGTGVSGTYVKTPQTIREGRFPPDPGSPVQPIPELTGKTVVGTKQTPYPATGGAPPPPPAPPFIPYSPPGYGEEFFKKTQADWLKPGAAANYWNGQQGFLNTPQAGYTAARGYQGDLGSGAGSLSAMENLFNKYNQSGELSNPWAAEGAYAKNQQFFQTPGAMENYYRQHQNDLNGPGALESHQGGIAGDLASSRTAQNYYSSQQGSLGNAGYTEKYANGYRPEVSASEQFLSGGGATGGLDNLYDRLYSEGSRKLGNESVARGGGGYNSGASLRAAEELNKDLAANHVKDVQAAVTQSDAAKIARQRYGLDVQTGADKAMQDRIAGGVSAASAADLTAYNRAKGLTDLYTGVDVQKRTNLTAMGGLAKDSQQGALDRIRADSEAAAYADTGRGKRLDIQGNAARDAGAEALNRITAAGNMGLAADTGQREQVRLGGDLSRDAGIEDITRRTGGQVAAGSAQKLEEDRQKGVLDNLMKVAQSKAETYRTMTSEQRAEELKIQLAKIEGDLARGSIDANTAQQMRSMYMQMLQAPVAAAPGFVANLRSGRTAGGSGGGGGAALPTGTNDGSGGYM